MAANRERRSNAGARMSTLLEAEDEDDFYKTTYGGFEEEIDDNDYLTEDTASDITDSDIDVDENDEVKSDAEEGNEVKRKRRLVTKAYKEPKQVVADDSRVTVQRNKCEGVRADLKTLTSESTIAKTSLRKSTADKTRSTEDCLKEREAKAAMLRQIADKKRVAEVRRLTQEELLAEAKITEKINLRSLATYQKLELEKKKSRAHRQAYQGPFIRYHSLTVPLADASSETEINVDTEDSDQTKPPTSFEKCSRTYITFGGDHSLYRRFFPHRRQPRPAIRSMCPVTGRPAIYMDPLTETPYATIAAFRIIREAYQEQQQAAADESGLMPT